MGISNAEALICLNRIQTIDKFWVVGTTSSAPNFTPINASHLDPSDNGRDQIDGKTEN
jgi:hypothetical protein